MVAIVIAIIAVIVLVVPCLAGVLLLYGVFSFRAVSAPMPIPVAVPARPMLAPTIPAPAEATSPSAAESAAQPELQSTGIIDANDRAEAPEMDLDDLLYSTPTINDFIPSTVSRSSLEASAECIQIHEDDWRQFELIDAKYKNEIDAELADISKIWDEHSVSLGHDDTAFRKTHIRKRIPVPVQISISRADFEALVGEKMIPMSYLGYQGILQNAYAAQVDNLLIYATIQNDQVTTIGLEPLAQFKLPPEFLERFGKFIQDHNLSLVHWRSRTRFELVGDIMKYLGARKS
jgi:hypothetical protein